MGAIIKPIGAMLQAIGRLFAPPSDTIRGITQDAYWSPLQPIQPIGPPGTEPKGFQFWSGQNLLYTPRPDAEYSAAQLKQLATYPLARICIENVKDQLSRTPWEIQLKRRPGETKKEVTERQKNDKNIIRLSRFFEKPDREHMWDDWVRPLIEDMLVIDAPAVLVRKTNAGEMAELVVLRGESIVRYIDNNGLTPMPPDPAYAQNWYGIPLVNLSTEQLIYKPRNIVPRNTISSQLYGMSPTEQLAGEIEVGIQRLAFTLAYYTEGSVPGLLQVVPPGTSPDKISEAMTWMNSELAGNLAARRQIRLIQGWHKDRDDQIVMTKEPLLADPYDELHTKRLCFGYGVSPQRLSKTMNRASAEQADTAAEVEDMLPYFSWLKTSVIDYMIANVFKLPDYQWVPDPFRDPSFDKMADAVNKVNQKPVLTINEQREKMGYEERPEKEANELGAWTPMGWVAIDDVPLTAQAEGDQGDGKPKAGDKKDEAGAPSGEEKPAGGKPNGAAAKSVVVHGGVASNVAPVEYGFAAGTSAPSITTYESLRDVYMKEVTGNVFEAELPPFAKYSEDQPRDEHGRFGETGGEPASYSKPEIKDSPTAFLVKYEINDLPEHHLDGLKSIDFREQQYVQTASAAHGGKIVEAYGVYTPATQEIIMSSNKDNIAVVGGNVVAHEVGHHLHLAKLTDGAAAEWEKISDGGKHAMISAYARTNQGEHFAEAYRAYEQGGNKRAALKNLEPASYKYMMSLHKDSSSKVLPAGKFADTTKWTKRYYGS